jgi:hypothetical protein
MGVRAGSFVAALAEKYFDAVSRGDGVGAAERYFHPEILYVVNGGSSGELRSALPWLGRYRGLDEVRGFLTHMHANLEVTGFGPREVVADGERAAVFGWFGLRSRQTGEMRGSPTRFSSKASTERSAATSSSKTPSTSRLRSARPARGRCEGTARRELYPAKTEICRASRRAFQRDHPGHGGTRISSATVKTRCCSMSFSFAATPGSSPIASRLPERRWVRCGSRMRIPITSSDSTSSSIASQMLMC